MKVVCASFLLVSLILLSSSFLEITTAYYPYPTSTPAPSPSPSPSVLDAVCGMKCDYRCSKAGEHKRCMQYCQICCKECDACVPHGPSADKSECPCYANRHNSKGGPKCP